MCLTLTCYVSEKSKWFDVHFAMSRISKGKILRLILVSKSDVSNVWTLQVIDAASKIYFILFLNFPFYHEIFMFASSPSWYSTPEIQYLFSDQRQDVHADGNFLFLLDFQKKAKKVGRTWRHIFLKNPGVSKNISFKKTLEFLGLLLHPWKLLIKESFPQKPRKALHHLEIPYFFLITPDILHSRNVSSIHPESPCLQPPAFFSGIDHSTRFRLLFFHVLRNIL